MCDARIMDALIAMMRIVVVPDEQTIEYTH